MKRNILQSVAIMLLLHSSIYAQRINGDLNHDGSISVADVNQMVNVVLGKQDEELLKDDDNVLEKLESIDKRVIDLERFANSIKQSFDEKDESKNIEFSTLDYFRGWPYSTTERWVADKSIIFEEGDILSNIYLPSCGKESKDVYIRIYDTDNVLVGDPILLGKIADEGINFDLKEHNITLGYGYSVAICGNLPYNNIGIETGRFYDYSSGSFVTYCPCFAMTIQRNEKRYEIPNSRQMSQDIFDSRVMYCLGSSSTESRHGYYGSNGYPELVSDWTGMDVHNLGKSGYCMARGVGEVGSIYDFVDKIGTDAEYITIMIGGNDIWKTSVTYDDNGLESDFVSAYKQLLNRIIIKCPLARIGIIIPYIPAKLGGLKNNYYKMREASKMIAEMYQLQVLDIGSCGFNGVFDNDDKTSFPEEVLSSRQAAMCHDSSHLNEAGMRKMATVICKFVEGL